MEVDGATCRPGGAFVAAGKSTRLTELLDAVGRGESRAGDALFTAVYDELRSVARSKMNRESPGQTLQPTALVHEAYLRLIGDDAPCWENRAHFFSAAAEAMRRILIDRARKRRALKHGGDRQRVPLEDDMLAAGATPDLLELDQALTRLEAWDARKAEIVKLLYFLGFTVDETAALVGVGSRTVDRDWRLARAWLRRELGRDRASSPGATGGIGGMGGGCGDGS